MRSILIIFFFSLLSIFLYSCLESDLSKGERLAKTYCASCHLFPEPSLLDKKTWEFGIMPKMAFRMGMDYAMIGEISKADSKAVLGTIPDSPSMSPEDWDLIKKYYQVSAPDSLSYSAVVTSPLQQFQPISWKQPGKIVPHITFAKADSIHKKIWLADRSANLYQLDYHLKLLDSTDLNSPASAIFFNKDNRHLVLTMGIMDPNDQTKGRLEQLEPESKNKLIDSLKRPVYFEISDLNNDGREDFIVCEFGNYTGGLSVFENKGDGKYSKKYLNYLPGARKVVVKDINDDGLKDIIALITQGDEQIVQFTNAGDFNFRVTTLLRFPSVYGSSYFEMADFNSDGKDDILYTNGDNADYSAILKPYHGLRIYLNQGFNQYKEEWFLPLHGASQTITRDFDNDGDLDIAAISFFPDLMNHPEQGFIFLENQNASLKFKAMTTPLAASGRWMTMDCFDIDGDKDYDILLAALNFDKGVPQSLGEQWRSNMTSLLLLKNLKK